MTGEGAGGGVLQKGYTPPEQETGVVSMTEKPTYEELEQRVKALEQERLENQLLKEAMPRGEEWQPYEIEPTMYPNINLPADDLKSIINVEEIQSIMDEFYYLTNMVTAILDMQGNVIEATGWQDICTKFHRMNPQTAHNCTESDLFLSKKLKPGEYVDYKCKNGLWDVVTPLYVGTKHIGNIFTGQFFYDDDQIDEAFFIKQAAVYGFEKNSYMDAYRRIPRYNRETIKHLMGFLVKFTTYISRISLLNIQLQKEIHDRRQLEEALKESETRLRALLRAIPDLVWLKDIHGIYLFCNSRFESFFGAKEKEIVGKTDYDFVDKKLADFFKKNDNLAMKKKKPSKNEEEVIFAEDGHRELLETIKTPVYRTNGQIDGILSIGRDITGRKRIEQDLRTRESFLNSIITQSPFAMWIFDSKGTLQQVNPALNKFLNLTDEQLVGKYTIFKDTVIEKQGLMPLIRTVYEEGKTVNFTCDWDGNDIPAMNLEGSNSVNVEATMFPIHNPAGELTNVVLNWIDISERRKAEENILELNRNLEERVRQRTVELEETNRELEDFVYSVSHDLRAPLRSISGFAEIIHRRHKSCLNEEGQHYLDNVVKASKQMGELIDELLKFSRLGSKSIKIETVSLEDVLNVAVETLSNQIEKTRARITVPKRMPVVQGDLRLATHIFINILENALKYHKPNEPPIIGVGIEVKDGYAVVSISDNGIGIEPEYHDKIFKIFQRLHSQEDYPGTGIGLAAVKKALQIMGGEILIESEPDRGSVFKLKLPI